jgi:hypothetical protein
VTRTATHEVADALRALDLHAGHVEAQATLVLRLDHDRIVVDVKALGRVTVNDAERLARSTPRVEGGVPMVVADRIAPDARRVLNEAGWAWLDRRGHLRLRTGSLVIDADVPAADVRAPPKARRPLETDVGLDVATALLANPERSVSVRDVVAFTGRSLGAVHHAMRSLRAEHLVRSDGRPLHPELFWEVAERWRPQRVDLAGRPRPSDADLTEQLGIGLEQIADREGWAVRAEVAANAFGAQNVIRGDHPVDFYVPDDHAIRIARRQYGDAPNAEARKASVAVAPVRWACRRRVDPSSTSRARRAPRFAFVHPLIAALDLATDAARGREVLDEWTPHAPFSRVW